VWDSFDRVYCIFQRHLLIDSGNLQSTVHTKGLLFVETLICSDPASVNLYPLSSLFCGKRSVEQIGTAKLLVVFSVLAICVCDVLVPVPGGRIIEATQPRDITRLYSTAKCSYPHDRGQKETVNTG
jgi:hypothetical protein